MVVHVVDTINYINYSGITTPLQLLSPIYN